jgi:hypothetical protein
MHRPIDRIALQRNGTSSAMAKETGMSPKNILDEVLSSRFLATDRDVVATGRALLLASPIAD